MAYLCSRALLHNVFTARPVCAALHREALEDLRVDVWKVQAHVVKEPGDILIGHIAEREAVPRLQHQLRDVLPGRGPSLANQRSKVVGLVSHRSPGQCSSRGQRETQVCERMHRSGLWVGSSGWDGGARAHLARWKHAAPAL